jgi:hypothetical protein
VRTGALTSTNREPHDPKDENDSCSDPQEMHGESGSEKNQNEQQRKNQNHKNVLSIALNVIPTEVVDK